MEEKKLSNNEIWEYILKDLSLLYNEKVFEETFSNIRLHKVENEIFFILVENEFIKNKISHIYLDKIKKISKKYFEKEIFFRFISEKEIKKDLEKNFLKKEKKNINNNYYQRNFDSNLDSNYTFDNFVSGSSNIFAFEMAKKIANSERAEINPLYIFGSVGLGKTHLMQAIGNHILKKNPNKKVLYMKADGFIEDFTNKLRKERIDEFNHKYRSVDVLLVDDIQIMAEAHRTQMEFFKLFDYLNLNKKQIVITSDKSVLELNNIMERLTNRFKAGLVVDIKKPDAKHRLDILKKKFALQKDGGIQLKKEILNLISSHFYDNIREMEGALFRILNYFQIYNLEINLKNTKEALEPLLKNKKISSKEEINTEKIKNIISKFYNINMRDLIGKKRNSKYTLPRHLTIYFLKKINNLSYKMISFIFDKKYSSVFKAYKKIEKKIEKNSELQKVIELILKKIND
ncbi:chromosomal replication initiator protein DnaA [Columbia Basin potato purple top phytoplasma]|uniref:Chromosomal replication initiator protein DnaA n=1 Tax=Columbia Basin potato purple top phytoplasma TaxID=307134 RepID=A0ABT5L8U0_9MOLU|nr:chromosomal replication initiator protein DnaA [Columbia Basin potato purple top phytoplasma]MDC9032047.1 chromosomal replication initiator protein DnaA [Columbia Basin potato purple top phytoplasma]